MNKSEYNTILSTIYLCAGLTTKHYDQYTSAIMFFMSVLHILLSLNSKVKND
jgi:hypothetical protein